MDDDDVVDWDSRMVCDDDGLDVDGTRSTAQLATTATTSATGPDGGGKCAIGPPRFLLDDSSSCSGDG